MKTLKEQLSGVCRHFNGVGHGKDDKKACDAGVVYNDLIRYKELGMIGCMLRIPCTGKMAGSVERGQTVEHCDKYSKLTEQEIQAEVDGLEKRMDLLQKGLSACCEAPIDDSRKIMEGRYKGHGPRYCSKCHRLVYMV